MPARQRIHPIVQDLLDKLQRRFAPIKWLANNATGISIPIAKTIYTLFLRSVVDYLSPALCQLPPSSLEPLERFQNRVMRFILGCSASTRIVNMQSELNLTPLVDRIYTNVTYFTVKCLRSPHLAPHYSNVIREALVPNAPGHLIRPGGRNLIKRVCATLTRLNINVPAAEIGPTLPPWRVPLPAVSYTPASKADLPALQKQLALETIASVANTVPSAHHLFVDGSVQPDGSAACAVFSATIDPPGGGRWTGRRLANASSSTYCELNGLLDAVTLLTQERLNGVIVCDSQSALHALSSPRPVCLSVVNRILNQLAMARDYSLVIVFVWIPSHVGLAANETADSLAKAACALNDIDVPAIPSLQCYRRVLNTASHALVVERRNAERGDSVSIRHFENFVNCPHKYRRHGLMVRRHNVVSARLRLGYRPLWQVSQAVDVPQHSSCRLCDLPAANTISHYCLECPVVRHLMPRGQDLIAICKYLLKDDNLDEILVQYPHFGGY